MGGNKTVVIMECSPHAAQDCKDKLLAADNNSTMQKVLNREKKNGFELSGITVDNTRCEPSEAVSNVKLPVSWVSLIAMIVSSEQLTRNELLSAADIA